ncbi:MAG: hypothetical protein ACYCZR_03935 [Burkholderiales bacterium]
MSDTNARNHLFDVLTTVDPFTQLSCLGSMAFTVSAEAIRRAMKVIPDHPTPETMEAFFNEERNLKIDVAYAGVDEDGVLVPRTSVNDVSTTPGNYYEERRELSALLELRQFILDTADEVAASAKASGSSEERTLLNTMQFMQSQQKFDAVAAARQYTQLMKLGMKNYGQTRAQYVEQERLRAAREAETFAAKGEHAVQFLEGLDHIEGDVGERIWEQLYKRCVAKLIVQRQKKGMSLSWRTDAKQRQDIEADILFIEDAIVALDGEVPAEAIAPPEADEVYAAPEPAQPDMSHLIAMFQAMLQSAQPNVATKPLAAAYRVPGPVTHVQ